MNGGRNGFTLSPCVYGLYYLYVKRKKQLNKRMIRMRASEDIQKLMIVTRQTGKSEMVMMHASPFGPKHLPCMCSQSEFRKLCQIEEKDIADTFFESLSKKGWNLHFFRQQHKWLKDGELEYLYPVLYNWICNHDGWCFDDIITKYNDFARIVGLKVFKRR